jgi:hypothetical protein
VICRRIPINGYGGKPVKRAAFLKAATAAGSTCLLAIEGRLTALCLFVTQIADAFAIVRIAYMSVIDHKFAIRVELRDLSLVFAQYTGQ